MIYSDDSHADSDEDPVCRSLLTGRRSRQDRLHRSSVSLLEYSLLRPAYQFFLLSPEFPSMVRGDAFRYRLCGPYHRSDIRIPVVRIFRARDDTSERGIRQIQYVSM